MNIYASLSCCLLFTLSMQAMEKHTPPARELRPMALEQHPHHTTDDLNSTAPYRPLLDPSDDLRGAQEATRVRRLGERAFPGEMVLLQLLASCCPTFFSPEPFE